MNIHSKDYKDYGNEYMYLNISLGFEESPPEIEEAVFKYVITLALSQLHGDLGAAVAVDVLKYDQEKLHAILRVHSSGMVKLWSALTLYGYYNEKKCAFTVHKVSPYLLSLSGDSRQGVQELLGGCG